jgi:hypothetical protein
VNTPESIKQFNVEKTSQKRNYVYKFTSDIRLASPGVLIYNNKVAIISSKGGLNSIVLHNADYYENAKDLFDFIWKVLK